MIMNKKMSHNNLRGGISTLTSFFSFAYAFTLAEMMVVMLILSIVMAAFAPVMTTRNKVDLSSPWKYLPANNSDIYYGLGDRQTAYIGQRELVDTDPSTRLMINTALDTQNHMAFKRRNQVLGQLYLTENSIILGHGTQTGANNTVIGSGAFAHNTTGSENIAVGFSTLVANTTGSSNVAIGDSSLLKNTSGTNNSAIGTALMNNTTGSKNTSIGDDTLVANVSGSENVALGVNALRDNKASNNVAVGNLAMAKNTSGPGNLAIGYKAMASNTTSGRNIGIGFEALKDAALPPTTIGDSISIGTQVQADTVVGQYSIGVGYQAKTAGQRSVAVGPSAEASGNKSVAIGSDSKANGAYGVATGLSSKSGGDYSSAYGYYSNASGDETVAIGDYATASATNAIAIGYNAKAAGENGVAIGYYTNTTGGNGIALGRGASALANNVTAIGYNACSSVRGQNKTCIGANSGPTSSDQTSSNDSVERIYIGSSGTFQPPQHTSDRGRAVGSVVYNAPLEIHKSGRDANVILNSNLIVRGNIWLLARKYDVFGAIYRTYGSEDINVDTGTPEPSVSDRRLKFVGNENLSGLDKIRQLKVFNYTYKKDEKKAPHVGVIAQDLEKIFPNAVTKGEDGYLRIRMEDMFYAIVNAVKELDAKITKLMSNDDDKQVRIENLEKENKMLIKQNKQIQERLSKLEKQLK